MKHISTYLNDVLVDEEQVYDEDYLREALFKVKIEAVAWACVIAIVCFFIGFVNGRSDAVSYIMSNCVTQDDGLNCGVNIKK